VGRPAKPRDGLPTGGVAGSIDSLRNIVELLESGGNISLGELPPISCAAVAADAHNSLAMLQRRPDERMHDLLVRLDVAIGIAWNTGQLTDEINPPTNKSIRC
jgi:hypothetical protein